MQNFLLGMLSALACGAIALATATLVDSSGVLFTPVSNTPPMVTIEHPGTVATPSVPLQKTKTVMTTLFWAGEGSTAENGYISNAQSYWDEQWGQHFGGIDDPESRCGYAPCAFTPKENAFYVALPYAEYNENGTALKASASKIPWFGKDTKPLIKNRWVEVTYQGKTCYGQWEDVGPYLEDDFSYVFGEAEPHNTFGLRAGLDISPALWDCLGMTDNAKTSWRFVDNAEVPAGPWTKTITTSGTTWSQ